MKRSFLITIFLAVLIALFGVCSYTISPIEQVIVTQFGDPMGAPITEPGLHFKTPFIQVINRIPKNILPWDGQRNEMPTKDKLYISVDTFGRWKIMSP